MLSTKSTQYRFFFVDFSCLKKYNIVRLKMRKKSEKGGRHDRQNGMVSE